MVTADASEINRHRVSRPVPAHTGRWAGRVGVLLYLAFCLALVALALCAANDSARSSGPGAVSFTRVVREIRWGAVRCEYLMQSFKLDTWWPRGRVNEIPPGTTTFGSGPREIRSSPTHSLLGVVRYRTSYMGHAGDTWASELYVGILIGRLAIVACVVLLILCTRAGVRQSLAWWSRVPRRLVFGRHKGRQGFEVIAAPSTAAMREPPLS